jgi:glycosyltransferase involved in cell wall biosynthesis
MITHSFDCTVIVCVYNKSLFVRRAILSILNQTAEVKKIIIVDDCSTDNSYSIVKDLKECYGDLIYIIRNETNLGLVCSRNIAFQYVCTKYVAFLDADDYWSIDKIKLQIDEINKGYDFIYNSYCWCDGDSLLTERFVLEPSLSGSDTTKKLLSGNLISGSASSVLCSFDNICRVGYADGNLKSIANNFGEDWDLWLRLSRVSNFSFVPNVLTFLDSSGEYSSAPLTSFEKIRRYKSHFYIRSKHFDKFSDVIIDFQIQEFLSLSVTISSMDLIELKSWMNRICPDLSSKFVNC